MTTWIKIITVISLSLEAIAKSPMKISTSVKTYLIRRWAKLLAAEVRKQLDHALTDSPCKNQAGPRGQNFNPAFVSWLELLEQKADFKLSAYLTLLTKFNLRQIIC